MVAGRLKKQNHRRHDRLWGVAPTFPISPLWTFTSGRTGARIRVGRCAAVEKLITVLALASECAYLAGWAARKGVAQTAGLRTLKCLSLGTLLRKGFGRATA